MKSVNAAVSDAIRKDYAVTAKPRLIADWNMNRYKNPTADNVPAEDDEGYDIELFPIESIIKPNRPNKGIAKARIGESVIGDDYATNWQPRFYIGDIDDVYKYWTSPYPSDGNGVISKVEPYVLYDENVDVNKIVVKLENSWSSPTAFTVQVTTDGTTWSTVSTNTTIRDDGQIILYWNGTGWSTTRPADITALKSIRGVKFKVTALGGGKMMDGTPMTYKAKTYTATNYTTYNTFGKNCHFNLIALEAHREVDLTDRLISCEDTFDMSDTSLLYPIGTLTSNVGKISLSNVDGLFNKDNPLSPYSNDLLEPNVEFNLEYIYDIDGTKYSVQQFKMYGDGFKGEKDDTCSVDAADFSKYLQETTPVPAMWEGLTAAQIVWRVLDSVGFVDYHIDSDDRVVDHTIPVFWVDGTKSVWEVLDDLAKSLQAAIYFDGFGILQVKTRDTAFDPTKASTWTIRGEKSGTELPDLIEMSQEEILDANQIKVTYQTTKWSDFNNGSPSLQKVWEPEGVVSLRASALTTTLEASAAYFWIPVGDVAYWPWSGKVNIQGELIAYDGKHYVYYTGSSGATRNTAVVNSADERTAIDAKTPSAYRYKNHFTGALYITERGVWNSESKRHPVDAEGYSVRNITSGNRHTGVAGFKQDKQHSLVTLASGPKFKTVNDLLIATRGATTDTGYNMYGTMFKFEKEKGRTDQRAGIVIHNNGTNEDGYYIEFTTTAGMSAKERASRNELIIYSRVNGNNHKIGGKGIPLAIGEEIWYTVDVYFVVDGSDHRLNVWVNGRSIMNVKISGANKNAANGRFGMFTRGKTKASYEYLYGIARGITEPADDVSFFNFIQGGYSGGQWDREWVYGWRTRRRRVRKKWKKESYRWNQMFMDEFGPYVHEIREFDVKFDPQPVLHSRLYMTNDWNAICTEYRGNPFGGHFVIANAGRTNCIINGDDAIKYGSESRAVNQALTVIGRGLVISDAADVVVKNDDAIQKRGKIESELAGTWIQSKAMAQDIADWISKHWGNGTEQVSVDVFGNPLIEVGDLVTLVFERKGLTAAEATKFFVVGTSTSFEGGLTTSLTLRRVV